MVGDLEPHFMKKRKRVERVKSMSDDGLEEVKFRSMQYHSMQKGKNNKGKQN